MATVANSLIQGVLSVIVIGAIILFIWSKISGKPVGKIIKEILQEDG